MASSWLVGGVIPVSILYCLISNDYSSRLNFFNYIFLPLAWTVMYLATRGVKYNHFDGVLSTIIWLLILSLLCGGIVYFENYIKKKLKKN